MFKHQELASLLQYLFCKTIITDICSDECKAQYLKMVVKILPAIVFSTDLGVAFWR